jgi:hypothetical protein
MTQLTLSNHVQTERRLVRRLAKIVVWGTSCALLVGGAEAILRWSGKVPRPPDHVVSARPELYQAYPPYGYRLWPSRTTTYQYPKDHPRLLTVRSNKDGFREGRELDSPDGRRRVLVLGDSMVFGEGVEEEERFTERLEAEDPSWRVDNLGMTGFGPDLMLRAFEEVGLAVKPQVVILTMYTDDMRRVRPEYAGAGFESARFELRSGRLVSVPYPHFQGWSRSAIVSAIREVDWRLSDAELNLNAAILDRFREHASVASFKPVLLFLPGTSDTPKDKERRAWLRAYAERTEVTFLDLTEPILARPKSETLFIPDNWHLNPSGHRVVATELRRLLASLKVNGA